VAAPTRSVFKRSDDGEMRAMLSEMTNSSGHEVASHQEWRMSSADLWLRLAAAPTFAIMALLTAVLGGGARWH
jgi:hypothetical protein